MEYKTGDPDYVWKCHRCEELEQDRDALVDKVATLKSLSKNLEMHVRTGNDTIEELHQQLTTAQALADGLHVTCQTLADQNAQSRQREARLREMLVSQTGWTDRYIDKALEGE